jgi:SAM-dependent methyltransferase
VRPWTWARHPRRWHYDHIRRRLARHAIAGEGIEIGALHSPFPVPDTAKVRYVDRLTTDQLRAEYPQLGGQPLVDVDLVADGETLTTIPERTQDFVIASHFLEHCEDPIGTLKAHLRVLRPGGTLLLALPDRRHGIDSQRKPTAVDHIITDHEDGPEVSRAQHYRDWAELVDVPLGNITDDQIGAHAARLQQRHYSIHFHCWTKDELRQQLSTIIQRYALPAEITHQRSNHHEFLLTVTRRPAGPAGRAAN